MKTTKSTTASTNKSQPTTPPKPQNFVVLSLIAGLVLALLPLTASAQMTLITFSDATELSGTGYAPRIAVDGDNAVEVFQSEAGAGALKYRTGKVGITGGAITWSATGKYGTGLAPSVAMSGSYVIEVHEDGSGGLWYQTGKVAATGTITWAAAINYTTGYAPSVAASGTQILEVHQGTQSNPSDLYYEGAQFNPSGTVTFQGGSLYDHGFAPAIALAGATFVEVHQGTSPALWYHAGTIHSGNEVGFNASGFQFDSGYAPTVAIAGPTIVEVHEDGFGGEFYITGLLQDNGTITWGTSSRYQTGYLPLDRHRRTQCLGSP